MGLEYNEYDCERRFTTLRLLPLECGGGCAAHMLISAKKFRGINGIFSFIDPGGRDVLPALVADAI